LPIGNRAKEAFLNPKVRTKVRHRPLSSFDSQSPTRLPMKKMSLGCLSVSESGSDNPLPRRPRRSLTSLRIFEHLAGVKTAAEKVPDVLVASGTTFSDRRSSPEFALAFVSRS